MNPFSSFSHRALATFTALFQQRVGTRWGRSAHPALLTHNPPLVRRNACGSHRWPDLRAIAPLPSSCQDDDVLRRGARAAAPVAQSHAPRDLRRRSPAARSPRAKRKNKIAAVQTRLMRLPLLIVHDRAETALRVPADCL